MRTIRRIFFAAAIISGIFCASCRTDGGNGNSGSTEISLVTWNLQTFFDGEFDGGEYEEFTGRPWGTQAYTVRLKRLCGVMETLDADVFAFQEVENERILYDISNILAGKSWEKDRNWRFSCFAKSDGGATGCAVMSKLPLASVKTHSFRLAAESPSQPSVRPVMQLELTKDGRKLYLLVNHWKSKSGGAAKTEIWRNMQEGVAAKAISAISRRHAEAGEGIPAVILCGDFNRDAREFTLDFSIPGTNTVLSQKIFGSEGQVRVFSPWFNADGSITGTGSYFYRKKWEYIDNIFAYGSAEIAEFRAEARSPWANEDNTPAAYRVYNGKGYSDHLPLYCRVKF